MDISLNDELDILCEQVHCCSYCSKDKVLVKGKSYCHDCASGNVNLASNHSTMKNTSLIRRPDVALFTRST